MPLLILSTLGCSKIIYLWCHRTNYKLVSLVFVLSGVFLILSSPFLGKQITSLPGLWRIKNITSFISIAPYQRKNYNLKDFENLASKVVNMKVIKVIGWKAPVTWEEAVMFKLS